jgi:formamidopyrimidine-DNA glycosylase
MPELPKLEVVQEVIHRRILGQAITSAEVIPPGILFRLHPDWPSV